MNEPDMSSLEHLLTTAPPPLREEEFDFADPNDSDDFSDPFDMEDWVPFPEVGSQYNVPFEKHTLFPLYMSRPPEARKPTTFPEYVEMAIAEGFLRRLAQLPERDFLILRGSFLTRQLITPAERKARDLDFLATFDRDTDYVADLLQRVAAVPVEDRLYFHVEARHVQLFWDYNAHDFQGNDQPGVRAVVFGRPALASEDPYPASEHYFQIDIGFGDTLHPRPHVIEYRCLQPGHTIPLAAVRPELQTAWKLQGLFNFTDWEDNWRSKDLWDLYLLLEHAPIDLATFREAIDTAFADRNTPRDLIFRLVDGDFAEDPVSICRWHDLREELGDPNIPETPGSVVEQVGRRIRLAFETAQTR